MIASSSAVADSTNPSSGVAFGSLIDLARLRTGDATAEICEACNTINLGSARFCKGCSHKLPAFYAAMSSSESVSQAEQLRIVPERVWTWDLAAFWLVINSLTVITTLIPIA
jgi:hypothetical protein